eukprot:5658882-Prymnesium_polylepis.2
MGGLLGIHTHAWVVRGKQPGAAGGLEGVQCALYAGSRQMEEDVSAEDEIVTPDACGCKSGGAGDVGLHKAPPCVLTSKALCVAVDDGGHDIHTCVARCRACR